MVVNRQDMALPISQPQTAADVIPALTVPSSTAAPLRAAQLIPETSHIRYQADLVNTRAAVLNRQVLIAALNDRTSVLGKQSVQALLDVLVERGFGWSTMARMLAVSTPAIRKWRQGEGATPSNRKAVARLTALVEMLAEQFIIQDPVAWLEIPLASTAVTLVDAYAKGRIDLVFDRASSWISEEQVLDQLDKNWRASQKPREFETFRASDGQVGLRRTRR